MSRKRRKREGRHQSAGPTPPRRTAIPRVGPGVLLVLGCLALFALHTHLFRFTQDDAFISIRYAQNLVDGHGLVFNPGERVEGYSNFSWTLLLALLLRLGLPVTTAASALGSAFGVATIAVAARFACRLEGRCGPATVATAALLASNTALAFWAGAGLETALFAFLVTAGLERAYAPGVSRRGRALAPALLAMASLTRPDGPLVFAAWMALRALDTATRRGPSRDDRTWRGVVLDLAVFVAVLLPHAVWKFAYYGDLLPNTYYAKAGSSGEYLARGASYAVDFFRAHGAWGIAPLLALWAALRGGRDSIEARLLAVWVVFAAYIVLIGGDVLYVHRFWLPVLPVGSILTALGICRAGELLSRRFAPGRPRTPALVSAALLLVIAGSSFAITLAPVRDRRTQELLFVRRMRQNGEWFRKRFAPDFVLATPTVGAVGYYSGLPIIDLLGLTDAEIAHHPDPIPGLSDTWREIKYNAGSVLARRPDAILFSTGLRPSSGAEKAFFLYEEFFRSYFPYYYRSTPGRVNIEAIYRLRSDAPGPADTSRLASPDLTFVNEYCDGLLANGAGRGKERAIEHFRKSDETAPAAFLWAREWWASERVDMGDPAAFPVLRELASRDEHLLMAQLRIAQNDLSNREYASAEARYRAVAELDPDDSLPWIGLADTFRLRGDPESALPFAEKAIQRWNVDPAHLVLYGNLSAQLGRFDPAEWAYRRALLVDPHCRPAIAGLTAVATAREHARNRPDR